MEFLLTKKATVPFTWAGKMLAWAYGIPFVYDEECSTLKSIRSITKYYIRNIIHNIVVMLSFTRYIVVQCYGLYVLIKDTKSTDKREAVIIWIVLLLIYGSMGICFTILTNESKSLEYLICYIQDVIKSEDALILKRKMKETGKFQHIFFVLCLCTISGIILAPCGIIISVYFELPYFKYFKFPYIYALVVLILSIGFTLDCLIFVCVLMYYFLQMVVEIVWLNKGKNQITHRMYSFKMEKLHSFYRMQQLIFKLAIERMSIQTPFLILAGETAITVTICAVLRSIFNPVLQIGCIIGISIGLIGLSSIFKSEALLLEASPEFKHNAKFVSKRHLNSYRTIFIRLGNAFTLERQSWLTV